MSQKEEILKVVSDILSAKAHKDAASVAKAVEEAITKIGVTGRPLEKWDEQRNDANCTSGISSRTCYRVNHGDGTYSETWCDPWACL